MNLPMHKELWLIFCEQFVGLTKDTAAIQKIENRCTQFHQKPNYHKPLFQHIKLHKIHKKEQNNNHTYTNTADPRRFYKNKTKDHDSNKWICDIYVHTAPEYIIKTSICYFK